MVRGGLCRRVGNGEKNGDDRDGGDGDTAVPARYSSKKLKKQAREAHAFHKLRKSGDDVAEYHTNGLLSTAKVFGLA